VVRKQKRWKRRNRHRNYRLYCAYLILELSAMFNTVFYYEMGIRGYPELRFNRVTMVGGMVIHG